MILTMATVIIKKETLPHFTNQAERRRLVRIAGREALERLLAEDGYAGFSRNEDGWSYTFKAMP